MTTHALNPYPYTSTQSGKTSLIEFGAKTMNAAWANRKQLGIDPRKVNSWQVARKLTKAARPVIRIDAQRINTQAKWIGNVINKASQGVDIELASISNTSKVMKGVGTLGNALTVGLLLSKYKSETWTASTVVNTGFLLTGLIGSFMAIPVIGQICFAYGLIDVLSDGEISKMWDTVFPRNQPFSPPTYTFHVNR